MLKFISILLLLALSGCSTVGYYSQSIVGQLSLLSKRDSIKDLIEAKDTPHDLKQRLQQALEIRQFASERLNLPDNDSYTQYADLERPYVVWNVFAAPEFSLTPKNWCYFVVGCVSYRGYFAEQDALEMATQLKAEKYDVHVAGITAYSTLGWFDDPILNTMIKWKERALASLLFHELSHQVIYIKNETAFNEAFSSAVERIGTLQWLKERNVSNESYLAYLSAQEEFRHLLLETRTELDKLYNSSLPEADKRVKKQSILLSLKTRYESQKKTWRDGIHFDNWFAKPINNARLTSTMTYLQLIPAFYTLFEESDYDWNAFYESVKLMESLEKTERDEIINKKVELAPSITELAQLLN